MRLGDLSVEALQGRLSTNGLGWRTGPLVFHLRCRLPEVAHALHFGYADFPLAEHPAFADFHVHVALHRTWNLWSREVVFAMDGLVPMRRLPRNLAVPMLEWGLNWCVAAHCHQYLIIHAGVVEREGRVLLLPGRSGSGKSTLAAGLMLSGWRLLSDELALVRHGDGLVDPLPRPVNLKGQAIQAVQHFDPEAAIGPGRYVDPVDGPLGYLRPTRPSVDRAEEPGRPAWIVFPRYEPGSPLRSRLCRKGSALVELARCAPNYHLLGEMGFDAAVRLVDQCPCYDLRYSDLEEAVKRLGSLPGLHRVTTAPDL